MTHNIVQISSIFGGCIQPIVSKHYRKTQWFGRLLFYRHGISTPRLINRVRALKEGKQISKYAKYKFVLHFDIRGVRYTRCLIYTVLFNNSVRLV